MANHSIKPNNSNQTDQENNIGTEKHAALPKENHSAGMTDAQLTGARLRALRKKHGLTLEQVAEMIDTTSPTLQRYEVGKITNIPLDKVRKIAYIYGVEVSDLLSKMPIIKMDFFPDRKSTVLKELPPRLKELVDEDGIIQFSDLFPNERADDTTYAPIIIKDDSMAPDYKKNDQVRYKTQDKYQNGESVVVGIADEALIVRRIHFHENGSIILQAMDPAVPPVMFTQEEVDALPVKILGVPIELRRIL